MQVTSIELYDLLKGRIGKKEAKTLVAFVEEEVESKLESKKDVLVTQEEFLREIGLVRTEIANAKADLIKWMFIFIVGQTMVTIGVMIAVLQVFFK